MSVEGVVVWPDGDVEERQLSDSPTRRTRELTDILSDRLGFVFPRLMSSPWSQTHGVYVPDAGLLDGRSINRKAMDMLQAKCDLASPVIVLERLPEDLD